MHIYVYTFIHFFIRAYVYIYVCEYEYINTHIFLHVFEHAYTRTHTYVSQSFFVHRAHTCTKHTRTYRNKPHLLFVALSISSKTFHFCTNFFFGCSLRDSPTLRSSRLLITKPLFVMRMRSVSISLPPPFFRFARLLCVSFMVIYVPRVLSTHTHMHIRTHIHTHNMYERVCILCGSIHPTLEVGCVSARAECVIVFVCVCGSMHPPSPPPSCVVPAKTILSLMSLSLGFC